MAEEFTSVACGDAYTSAATIESVWKSGGGVFEVQDHPAVYSLQYGEYGLASWTPEAVIGTGGGSIPPGVSGIKFRNQSSGLVATVSALIRPAAQPHLALTFAAPLSVSTIQRVTALPSSPSDTQLVVLDLNTTFPGVEWLCVYNSSTGYWDVLSGSPLYAMLDGATTQHNVAGGMVLVPLTITIPNAGDYHLRGVVDASNAAGVADSMEMLIAKNGAQLSPSNSFQSQENGFNFAPVYQEGKYTLAIGDVVQPATFAFNQPHSRSNPRMYAMPSRIH